MPCIYQADEEFGYRYMPNATGWMHRNFELDNIVQINSMGFHDVEHTRMDGEGLEIVAVGDSFTAALHVETTETWTQILQSQLRTMGHTTAEVFNLGLDGTGTDVHLGILKKYLEESSPQFVILAFHASDISDLIGGRSFRECYQGYVLAFQNEDQRERLRHLADAAYSPRITQWLFDKVYLYRAATYLFWRENYVSRTNFLKPSHLGVSSRQSDSATMPIGAVFRELKDLSEQYRFELLIIPVPAKTGTDSLNELQKVLPESNLTSLGIVDVFQTIDELLDHQQRPYKDMFWRYDGHLNAFGNNIFGQAVAKAFDSIYRTSLTEQ